MYISILTGLMMDSDSVFLSGSLESLILQNDPIVILNLELKQMLLDMTLLIHPEVVVVSSILLAVPLLTPTLLFQILLPFAVKRYVQCMYHSSYALSV